MKTTAIIKMAMVPALLLALVACNADQEGNPAATPEPVSTPAASDDAGKDAGEAKAKISVDRIDHYENIAISDWMDEDSVIVSKENESLGKMSLEELSDSYARSLYLYHLNTKEYELIKEQKDTFLGDATLSSDKKHLLYSEFSLGDPVYHVMNLDTRRSFAIAGDPIGGAISAHWADAASVTGPAYSGDAFTASTTGEITTVEGLNEDALFIVQGAKDKLYYNTTSDESLQLLDLNSNSKVSLNLDHVYGVLPSPEEDQLLVLQYNDPEQTLILCDADGANRKIIAEGTELGGVSWSPDQQRIAYSLESNENGTAVNGLYVYDLLTGESTRVATDLDNPTTSWGPSGQELAYTEWNEYRPNSGIIHLTIALPE